MKQNLISFGLGFIIGADGLKLAQHLFYIGIIVSLVVYHFVVT